MSTKQPISELERQIMNIIWKLGTATAAGIQQSLAAKRPLKDSTIRTVLLRLEEKSYVRHEVDGRTFIYSCTEPPGSLAARAVKQIVDRFCHGSMESLLVGMVENEIVDTDELLRIADRLSRERKKSATSKKRKKAE